MTPENLKAILQQVVDENPFSIRAVLKVAAVEFTDEVPTLAVTRETRPRLLVNLDFVTRHCKTDAEVEAVLCHEFLHVLLSHTESLDELTPELHLALDAVVNAIIHRELGPTRSAMMSRYYGRAKGLDRMLRPMNGREKARYQRDLRDQGSVQSWVHAWHALYDGKLVVDDIAEIARDLAKSGGPAGVSRDRLIGNHDDTGLELPPVLAQALDRAMREMNGSGIWRQPRGRGVGANPYDALFAAADARLRRWEEQTLRVLRKHVEPDRTSRARRDEPRETRLPVLTSSDRRGFLRALSSPFLPECVHASVAPVRKGTAQVYLDVSGSMSAEMPLVIAMLGRVSLWIRRPFWAFSDVVAPATIRAGRLETQTSGGTSLGCVLDHVERTKPASAVIVTDGFVEETPVDRVRRITGTRLHAIVTRDGNPISLQRAGIPYTQLERLPS